MSHIKHCTLQYEAVQHVPTCGTTAHDQTLPPEQVLPRAARQGRYGSAIDTAPRSSFPLSPVLCADTGVLQSSPCLVRFVHVSSAGVTRPNRPGINVDQEPPAVKLNDALGGLLTYKLAGEDAVRMGGECQCIAFFQRPHPMGRGGPYAKSRGVML